MVFTSLEYAVFLAAVFAVYWIARVKTVQNALLLAASCLFYGYVHPWFLALIAGDTALVYLAGMGMARYPARRRLVLAACVVGNLALLGFFKYFNFFAENVHALAATLGLHLEPTALRIFLPVGISYYVFRGLSYAIDVYHGRLEPRRSPFELALYMSFFPAVVAGPIDRAPRLLPQLETPRRFDLDRFGSAIPLLTAGLLKKVVIADNLAVYVDKIFMLEHPSGLLLACGGLAYTMQIYADFSGYTDIARGSARLLGLELMENFASPYLSVSPSDFWRRWHISFSTWIRDYIYIPLGGSRVAGRWRFLGVVLVTFGLSGLWHGAAWTFVIWGLYHGSLLFIYHQLGMGGRYVPSSAWKRVLAVTVMFVLAAVGWTVFRASSMTWLVHVFREGFRAGTSGDSLAASSVVLAATAIYSAPLFALKLIELKAPRNPLVQAAAAAVMVAVALLFYREGGGDFIYFQF